MQTVSTIGLDIAKSVFQVHGVDVFPSLTSVRHPVGEVAHDKNHRKSGVMVKDGGALARATSIGLRAAMGVMPLVAFLATASRGAAAITIIYRVYGER
jgi:hypothetical protein